MEYTKGEWKVISAEFTDKGVAFEVVMLKQEICVANANLIAAAPDLYEACKYLARRCEDIMVGYTMGLTPDTVNWASIVNEADRRARLALAKAESNEC